MAAALELINPTMRNGGLRLLSSSESNSLDARPTTRRKARHSFEYDRAQTPRRSHELEVLKQKRRVSEADAKVTSVLLGISALAVSTPASACACAVSHCHQRVLTAGGGKVNAPKTTSTRDSALTAADWSVTPQTEGRQRSRSVQDVEELRRRHSVSAALGDAAFREELEQLMGARASPEEKVAPAEIAQQASSLDSKMAPNGSHTMIAGGVLRAVALTLVFVVVASSVAHILASSLSTQAEIMQLREELEASVALVAKYEERSR